MAGEVSNCTYHSSGHLYFSLKDEHSRTKCVMFKHQVSQLQVRLRNGMRVVVSGSISVYERDGQYQLYASHVEEAGMGDWFIAFQQLKDKLDKEGWLDPARKRPLPAFPLRIGIITSETGAALQDFLTVLSRRWPIARLYLFPAQVQGAAAPDSLTQAMIRAAGYPLDVILLGRGGGSIEELWAFNSESLAYAVIDCPIPVITGIGHETDFTIADFVADQRANTPTAAAELAVPDQRVYRKQMDQSMAAMIRIMRSRSAEENRALAGQLKRPPFRFPTRFIDEKKQALDQSVDKMVQSMWLGLFKKKETLDRTGKMLHQLSPHSILDRGYAMIRDEQGRVITSTRQVSPQDSLQVQLKDGHIDVHVADVKEAIPRGEKENI